MIKMTRMKTVMIVFRKKAVITNTAIAIESHNLKKLIIANVVRLTFLNTKRVLRNITSRF